MAGFGEHKLKFQIDADGKGARRELNDIDGLIGKMGAGVSSLAGPASIAAAGIATIGTAAIAGGVALFNLTKEASDFGSTIFDASKKTGLGAESLSAMKFAADQSGTSLENITGGIAKFSKTVGDAADGSKEAAARLKAFGLEPQEAIADLDGALDKVFKRIIAAPPGIERITLAQKAFGKSGADLLPFLDSFNGDLAGLVKRAKELGVTIDDKAARAADEFGDQLDTLSAQLTAAGRTIGTAFMDPFTKMASGVSDWLAKNKGELEAWAKVSEKSFSGATSYVQKFVDFVNKNGTAIRIGLGIASAGMTEVGYQGGKFLAQSTIDEGNRLAQGDGSGAQGGGRGTRSSGYGEDDQSTVPKVNTITVGRGDRQKDVDRGYEQHLDNLARLAQKSIDDQRLTMDERIELREAEYSAMFSVALRYAADVGRTEEDLARYREGLDEQTLEYRKTLLLQYLDFLATQGPAALDEMRTAQQQLKVLEQNIETQRNTHAANEKKRQAAALEDEKKLRKERNASWNDYVKNLKAATDAQDELDAKQGRRAIEGATVMGGAGIGGAIGRGLGVELVPMFDEVSNAMLSFQERMALVGQDINNFVGTAIGGMIDGLSQMAAAWLAGGDISAEAALRMASGAALGIAMTAGMKAIFELAEGYAALANPFLAPTAPMHFKAAATYGIVAGIAGAAGVGLGLAGRAAGGGQGSASGSTGTASSRRQENLSPISRVSDDAYISGRRGDPATIALTRAVDKLTNRMEKITTASPGEVLVRGAQQRKGFIADQFAKDVKANSSRGSAAARAMGFK